MEKKKSIFIISISIIILIFLIVIIYQHTTIKQLSYQINTLEVRIEEERGQSEVLNSKVKEYLGAQERSCEKDTTTCLDELIEELKTKTGPDCSLILDGICPPWCKDPPGEDADCCIEAGMEWIPGRGCFNKN